MGKASKEDRKRFLKVVPGPPTVLAMKRSLVFSVRGRIGPIDWISNTDFVGRVLPEVVLYTLPKPKNEMISLDDGFFKTLVLQI